MIEQSGGRAGPNEFDFVNAGYKLDEIEPLRQQLLSQNDVGKVRKAIRKLGLRVKRGIIQAVKSYNFDSQGLGATLKIMPRGADWPPERARLVMPPISCMK